jgi:hypothetical protein
MCYNWGLFLKTGQLCYRRWGIFNLVTIAHRMGSQCFEAQNRTARGWGQPGLKKTISTNSSREPAANRTPSKILALVSVRSRTGHGLVWMSVMRMPGVVLVCPLLLLPAPQPLVVVAGPQRNSPRRLAMKISARCLVLVSVHSIATLIQLFKHMLL